MRRGWKQLAATKAACDNAKRVALRMQPDKELAKAILKDGISYLQEAIRECDKV